MDARAGGTALASAVPMLNPFLVGCGAQHNPRDDDRIHIRVGESGESAGLRYRRDGPAPDALAVIQVQPPHGDGGDEGDEQAEDAVTSYVLVDECETGEEEGLPEGEDYS